MTYTVETTNIDPTLEGAITLATGKFLTLSQASTYAEIWADDYRGFSSIYNADGESVYQCDAFEKVD